MWPPQTIAMDKERKSQVNEAASAKEAYEAPKIESVKLTEEAAEALT